MSAITVIVTINITLFVFKQLRILFCLSHSITPVPVSVRFIRISDVAFENYYLIKEVLTCEELLTLLPL
jgi:hypothetical protein